MADKNVKQTPKDETKASGHDAGQAEVQQIADQENAQGFRGFEVDSTPNENYTVSGVVSGAPTPETDPSAAAQARKDTGLGLSALEHAEQDKVKRGEK